MKTVTAAMLLAFTLASISLGADFPPRPRPAASTSGALPPLSRPVQSGNTILTALSAGNRTVLLLTTLDPNVSRFIVQYTVNDSTREEVAIRPGNTVQDLAAIVIDAPPSDISNVAVQGVGSGNIDKF